MICRISCISIINFLEYLMKKRPVPTKWGTVGLIKVESCNVLLPMLLGCIRRYSKSALRYIFFNFGNLSSGHCICVSKDVRTSGYCSKPEGVREKWKFGKHRVRRFIVLNVQLLQRESALLALFHNNYPKKQIVFNGPKVCLRYISKICGYVITLRFQKGQGNFWFAEGLLCS